MPHVPVPVIDKLELRENMFSRGSKNRIVLTEDNIHKWPNFAKLYEDGRILLDKSGRFRYPHGAPVGDLVLVRTNKDGEAIYKESADEWFDPDSPKAQSFEWPE